MTALGNLFRTHIDEHEGAGDDWAVLVHQWNAEKHEPRPPGVRLLTAVGQCRWCQRPIVAHIAAGWLHTDGRADCLDVWRWDPLDTVAEPQPQTQTVQRPEPTYRRSPNSTGKNGR